MGDFHLEKWYLDVADTRGQAFIGYAATLKWKWINLSYTGFTFLSEDHKIRKRNSFSGAILPKLNSGIIEWQSKDCRGTWQANAEAVEELLLNDNHHQIRWNCLQPSAYAHVTTGTDAIEGLGYAERIELNFPPWQMPINELHWGRFLSPGHSITWIKWIGPLPKNLVYHNGERTDHAVISKEEISFNGLTLALSGAVVMRSGSLASTVFKKFPSLAKLFPKSILQLQENKWLSRGDLYRGGKCISTGKAIHEVVQW